MRSFGKQCNRKLSPIRMRRHPSRSNRKPVTKPVLYLDRSNSCRYHRSTASCGNYVHEESSSPLQNYVDSHSLDRLVLRPYLLPRAKWDESRMTEYIRDSNKLEGGRSTGQSKEFINDEHLNADSSKASSQQSVVSTALSNKNVLTNTDPDFPDPPRLNQDNSRRNLIWNILEVYKSINLREAGQLICCQRVQLYSKKDFIILRNRILFEF